MRVSFFALKNNYFYQNFLILKARFLKNPRFFTIFAVIVLIFLLCGGFWPRHKVDAPSHPPLAIPKVCVINSEQISFNPILRLSAETKANRKVTIRAEIAGKITEVLVEKGQFVCCKQPLLRIIDYERGAKLESARAKLSQQAAQFKAAEKLKTEKFIAENSFLETKAKLDASLVDLKKAESDCDNLLIKAPFESYYEDRLVEEGDYVNIGTELVNLVDISSLKLSLFVPEKEILCLKVGQKALVKIGPSLTQHPAEIIFISKVAQPKTRSFLIELRMDNSQTLFPQGLTAVVEIQRQAELVHKLPASAMVLNDQGILGVMIIGDDNIALFQASEICQSDADGNVLVKNLAAKSKVITVGGSFIKDGQVVEPVLIDLQQPST